MGPLTLCCCYSVQLGRCRLYPIPSLFKALRLPPRSPTVSYLSFSRPFSCILQLALKYFFFFLIALFTLLVLRYSFIQPHLRYSANLFRMPPHIRSAEDALARAEANGYKRGQFREEDAKIGHKSYVTKTLKNHNWILRRYLLYVASFVPSRKICRLLTRLSGIGRVTMSENMLCVASSVQVKLRFESVISAKTLRLQFW